MTLEELEKRIEELEMRLDVFESGTGFMSAQMMVDYAKKWTENNPSAWRYIREYADDCIENNRRFSIQKACEYLRDSKLVLNLDGDYKINNSLTAPLTRMLVKDKPELKPLVDMRRSKTDRFFHV